MTKEYTKYIVEGRIQPVPGVSYEWAWTRYDYQEWDNLEEAVDELKFYRKIHSVHDFRIVKKDYTTKETILDL
jgi:hypothetical protein